MRAARSVIITAAAAVAASVLGLPGTASGAPASGAKPHPVDPGHALSASATTATADRWDAVHALTSIRASGTALQTVTLEVRTTGGQRAVRSLAAGVHALGLPAQSSLARIGYLSVSVPAAAADATTLRLQALPGVVSVSRAQVRHELMTPTDPLYATNQATSFDAVHAPAAWDVATGDAETIAVIDGGFDVTHPDLAGKISLAWDVVASTANVTDPAAIQVPGHGTATASVAAAATNNGIGMAGSAPGAHLMLIKVSDGGGTILSNQLASGIVYAVDHGANVLSISLGSTGSDPTETAAIAYAVAHGVVVVAAAGNSANTALDYPAADAGVISVGATNSAGTATAAFSTYGSWVDVAAPGEGITVAVPTSVDPSGYTSLDGTSFAAPLVAGEAAILLSARPTSAAATISDLIINHTNNASLGFAHGLVRFDAAVSSLPADTVLTTPASSDDVSGVTAVSATSGAPQVRFDIVGTSISTIVAASGGAASTTLPTYGLNGAATFRATGCVAGVCAVTGSTADVTVSNGAPTLTSPIDAAKVGTSFTASATAPGGGVRFILDGATSIGFDATAPYSLSVDTTAIVDGAHVVTAVQCDVSGKSCDTGTPSAGATITVSRLRPRVSVSPTPFSPNADGRRDTATLTYALEQRQSVVVRIYGPTGALVRGPLALGTEKATGTYSWIWNGRTTRGALLPNGTYRVELRSSHVIGAGTPTATTVAGLATTTVRIDLSAPRVATNPPSLGTFYPYKDSYRDVVLLGATSTEALASYVVYISNSKGVTVRTLAGRGHAPGRATLGWNGRNNSGRALPAGVYGFRVLATDLAGNRSLSVRRAVALSTKRLVWRTSSATVMPHASVVTPFIGYCSEVVYDANGWTGSLGYYSDYNCSSNGDANGELAATKNSYRLPAALAYGNIRLSAYGTARVSGYPDVAAMVYYDRSGALSNVGVGLGANPGTYSAPTVASSSYLYGGRTLQWLAGTTSFNWYVVRTFTVTWQYAVLA